MKISEKSLKLTIQKFNNPALRAVKRVYTQFWTDTTLAHVGRKRIEEEAVGITERKHRPDSVQEHKCPIDFKRHIPTHVYNHSVGIANLA